MTRSALLTVDRRQIRVVTTCEAAYSYLESLDHLTGIRPYHFEPHASPGPAPTVRYRDVDDRRASFDTASRILDVAFPWEADAPELFDVGEPFHNLILYPIRLLLERLRQEHGEYTLHASAVTRDGHAIVLSGDAEAGKTTTALNLCHEHGFSLYANDQTVLSLRDGRPSVVHGDHDVSLRLSSAERYSAPIAHQVFAVTSADDPWEVKRDVAPRDLGLDTAYGPVPLSLFVKIRLDDTLADSVVQLMSARAVEGMRVRTRRALFRAKVDLYREITQIVRGAAFTPLRDADLSLVDLYLPSLDEPRFLSRRVDFLNTLFGDSRAAYLSVRGPLGACAQTIVDLFESLSQQDAITGLGAAPLATGRPARGRPSVRRSSSSSD